MDFGMDLAPSASGIVGKLGEVVDTTVQTITNSAFGIVGELQDGVDAAVRTITGWPLHVQIIAGLVTAGVLIHIVRGVRGKPGY